ncbi:MAG TPA: rhomboid family intramembrane serine protease [Candidatus Paceibacterota bacterium]|nr:rhomboid family intramembrane serine protease [Candidatus Paceibacterota bacterium]
MANPEKFRFYALWLSLICIVVFILQNIFSGFTDLFLLTPEAVPEIWRFLTSIFLHGDITHLLFNLFALALFGSILEKFIGGKKFLLVFFASGIFANLIAVNFYSASLGASGAIYGILGCLVIIKPLMMVWAFGFPMPMFIAGILWTAGSVLGIFMPSNIGHVAHLSGIAIGLLLGIIYRISMRGNRQRERKIEISEPDMRSWEHRYIIRR